MDVFFPDARRLILIRFLGRLLKGTLLMHGCDLNMHAAQKPAQNFALNQQIQQNALMVAYFCPASEVQTSNSIYICPDRKPPLDLV